VELRLDDEGYLDRQCPAEVCAAQFKVLNEGWVEKVSDEQVSCPICGQVAPATEWSTEEQSEAYGQDFVRQLIEGSFGQFVGAFQQYTEAIFERLPNASSFKRR
jgi:hypothetical protein